jgi:polar amino acid transport system substrate-binding protein
LAAVALLGWQAAEHAGLFGLGTDGSLRRVLEAGALRVGYAVEAPYAFVAPSGEVTGESPATARLVAAVLGVPHVEWVQMPFDALIEALLAGRIDLIAAGMFITPQRAGQVAFSLPTVRVAAGLLVPAGNPLGLHSYGALSRQPGLRVAVLAGSAEQARLRQLGPARLIEVPDARTGNVAVATGHADAFALSLPTLRWMVMQSPGKLEAVPLDSASEAAAASSPADSAEPPASDAVAFAFRPADVALREAWNRALVRLRASGAQLEAIRPFGFTAASLIGPPADKALR